MSDTKIEWATKSWNPITGCTPISEGCANCYAKRMAKRLAGRYGYPKDEPFKVTFHPERLNEPTHWYKPQRVFVCSMGDIFHKDVTDEQILAIYNMMEHAFNRRHTFIVLTKRVDRLAAMYTEFGRAPVNEPIVSLPGGAGTSSSALAVSG